MNAAIAFSRSFSVFLRSCSTPLSQASSSTVSYTHLLKNGDSLSNYGVNDNTKEKYAKLCIVYENSHGDLQNVSLNTFKGDILHFYDFNGEDYRIGPNKQLVDFIIKHTGYRVLPATAFDKIEKITVKYNNKEYNLSAQNTAKFIKIIKKLDKRQDEFHDYNFTALAYTCLLYTSEMKRECHHLIKISI